MLSPDLTLALPDDLHHQQYLDRNKAGYCGLGGTGIACPVGVASAE
jgi:peptide-methionine (S)-S-oxide reductase